MSGMIGVERSRLGKISDNQRDSALKYYMKLKEAVEADPSIKAIGVNCLNESHYI